MLVVTIKKEERAEKTVNTVKKYVDMYFKGNGKKNRGWFSKIWRKLTFKKEFNPEGIDENEIQEIKGKGRHKLKTAAQMVSNVGCMIIWHCFRQVGNRSLTNTLLKKSMAKQILMPVI